MANELTKVDHSSLKANQAAIIGLLLVAYIARLPWLATVTGLVMLLGTVGKRPGFGFLYFSFLKPLGWVKPDILQDNPEPHRFAQGFGGTVLIVASLAFLLGTSVTGWALTWLVIAFAALNLFVGFCTGCAVYYWLHRLNTPGFIKAPPEGIFPGMRPKGRL
ncbi:MAG: DUF4395 domain-containing protein [Anaerolineaceae bacterium]|nr:DUF4395 domain-containing protein [Anaerolineaceae bacterium]